MLTKIKQELIRSVRGRMSQWTLNKKLQLEYNQVSRWETNQKQIKWCDFVRFCTLCKKDVSYPLYSVFSFVGDPLDTTSVIYHLSQTDRLNQIGKIIESNGYESVTRFTIRRWLRNNEAPTVENILSLMNQKALTLFLSNFMSLENFSGLNQIYTKHYNLKMMLEKFPMSVALFYYLERDGLIDQPMLLEKFNITSHQLKELLILLETNGKIKRLNNNKVKIIEPLSSREVGGDHMHGLKIKKYWQQEATKKMQIDSKQITDSLYQYIVIKTNSKTYQQILSKARELDQEITKITKENSDRKTHIKVINLQIIDI